MTTTTELCPCGTQKTYAQCCQPVIQKRRLPETAEDLLRARYSSFVKHEIDFILATHHSKTKAEVNRAEIEEWSKSSKWLGLEIVQAEAGGAKDEQGNIAFCAKYEAEGKSQNHWEMAYFERENGEWRFLDAKGLRNEPFKRTEPKAGRNDPCPCGSGQKFKKCHGA